MSHRLRRFHPKELRGVLLLLIMAATPGMTAHPLHTTITELTYDTRTALVTMQIRVFADDFGTATQRAAPDKDGAERSVHYLARHLELRGSDDRVVVLEWVGVREAEGLLWIQLQGRAPAGLRGGTLRQGLMFDLFTDQVNVLKIHYGGTQRTLLFTRGAERKRLP